MRPLFIGLLAAALVCIPVAAHDAHGRASAPLEARSLRSPLQASEQEARAGQALYAASCAGCHGDDGKSRTRLAGTLKVRPTDLSGYLMESMTDGEIYWVIAHGIAQPGSPPEMPAFGAKLDETSRWQLVLYVRELRSRERAVEVAHLGPYRWNLPPGFPYPNVPADNPMTAEKVELGRHLFYDRRLSINRKQSCATCHRQARAFADTHGRGVGTTGQVHPRGPMSLANVAYSPVLTWGNPNMRTLEAQALVPMFGDDPVELGLSGKEQLLIERLKAEPAYRTLFPAAFPGQPDPYTLANITKAIASFERTILSGDSPYDRFQRGDDPDAISESAKRGQGLFFSEQLECFHCHGGFNFTGTVDYFGKGFAEIEFHNTGLYNVKGQFSYPIPNLGIYDFTQNPEDVGKFKAPTLRNIAVTAPYMHDGSIRTLEEVIDHYRAGGRTVKSGPNAGVGADNPNKSEFVRGFDLSPQEKADLIAFLRSLTDETLLTDPKLSDPWPASAVPQKRRRPRYVLHGEIVRIDAEGGVVALDHDEVPGLLGAMKAPNAMEFLVPGREQLAALKPGQRISASVRRQGRDFVLDDIRPALR